MLLTDFYELAKEEHACDSGLDYLKNWMNEHPKKKNVVDFLKAHRNMGECWSAFSVPGYMRWIFANMLDWTELQGSEHLPFFTYNYTNKTIEFLRKILGTHAVCLGSENKIVEALIRAYEDE